MSGEAQTIFLESRESGRLLRHHWRRNCYTSGHRTALHGIAVMRHHVTKEEIAAFALALLDAGPARRYLMMPPDSEQYPSDFDTHSS